MRASLRIDALAQRRFHLFSDRSLKDAVAMASAAAAAADDADVMEQKGETARAAPKRQGRGRGVQRPRIDIDDQIEEANRLATVMKKLSHAAKMAERNGQRVKQRLVRKAGKLSPEDLERIAVLKRCGLLPEEPGTGQAGHGCGFNPFGTVARPMDAPRHHVFQKMAEVVGNTPGVTSVLETVDELKQLMSSCSWNAMSNSSASSSMSTAASLAKKLQSGAVPRASPLPSNKKMRVSETPQEEECSKAAESKASGMESIVEEHNGETDAEETGS